MATSRLAISLSFVAGACATAAVPSIADDTAPPAPAAAADTSRYLVTAADAPQRHAPNGSGTVTILARGDNAFVARLELAAAAAVPEHQDATEEYIHVLEGGGLMTIDGQQFDIAAGDTVYMPAGATVQFANGDTKLVALQVFAGPEPAAKYDTWTPVDGSAAGAGH